MEITAIVTVLILLQTFWFAFEVGKARTKSGISAPACGGSPELERAFRVHQNTLEQVVLVVPALWIFSTYVHVVIGAAIGVIYLIGRFVYRSAYLRDPATRSTGFSIGAIALAVLALGGLIGAVMDLLGM